MVYCIILIISELLFNYFCNLSTSLYNALKSIFWLSAWI